MKTMAILGTAAILAAPAGAAPMIDLFSNIGPSSVVENKAYVFGPPASFDAYGANALGAMLDGETSRGGDIADTPTAFNANAGHLIKFTDILATEFPSWRMNFSPTGAFANEMGTWWRVGLRIEDADPFKLANVLIDQSNPFFSSTRSLADVVKNEYPEGGFSWRTAIGIYYGADGVRGTADDVVCDSSSCDPFTQPLNLVAWRGWGKSDYITTQDFLDIFGGDPAALYADAVRYYSGGYGDFTPPFTWRFGYSVYGDDGALEAAKTFTGVITGVPEPDSWAMLVVGFGLAGAMLRRRRSRQTSMGQRA